MKKIILFIIPLIFFLFACNQEQLTITGKVAVAGHEPFTYVRIIDKKRGEFRLVGPNVDELRQSYQGSVVTLRGYVAKEAQGPGMPTSFYVKEIVAKE